jgi:hypothetical protein
MPCPWYQHGMCTSPKLTEPTDAIVSIERCTSDSIYRNCSYYVESSSTFSQKRQYIRKERMIKIYPPIHVLPQNTKVECIDGELIDLENGIRVGYCRILDRPLTRYEIYICNKNWQNCPYRFAIHTANE